MKTIDLKEFALHSQKLPLHYLEAELPKTEMKTFKLLTAHLSDFFLCVAMTSFMGSMYVLTFKSLLLTNGLRSAYSEVQASQFFMTFLPLTLVSYFFSCYFLNHGQTWGMHLTKTRIEMTYKSFRETFRWAMHSFLLCLSGGTYMVASFDRWKSFSKHDYLYHELMLHKDVYSVDLLQMIEESHEEYSEMAEAA